MRTTSALSTSSIRVQVILSLLVIVPVGWWLRRLDFGPDYRWVSNWGGSLAYEIFWILLIFLWLARPQSITPIAVGVWLVTCLLEVAQLWHPPWLEAIRATFLGRAILGTTFMWQDMPIYPLGCIVGWLWLKALCKEHPPSCKIE